MAHWACRKQGNMVREGEWGGDLGLWFLGTAGCLDCWDAEQGAGILVMCLRSCWQQAVCGCAVEPVGKNMDQEPAG